MLIFSKIKKAENRMQCGMHMDLQDANLIPFLPSETSSR
jgi:hypothetical protein